MKTSVFTHLETNLSTFVLSTVCRTIRIREKNDWFVRKRLFKENRGGIFCLWHNRLFFLTYYIYSRFIYGYPKVSVLASSSRDGEKIANVIQKLGGSVIWGSSSRNSKGALRRAIREASDHRALFVTPDGPRGPRYRVEEGTPFIARVSEQPIIPVTFGVSRYTQLNSWDRFIIPHPFSEGIVLFGDPVWPGEASSNLAEQKKQVQEAMYSLDRRLKKHGCDFQ